MKTRFICDLEAALMTGVKLHNPGQLLATAS